MLREVLVALAIGSNEKERQAGRCMQQIVIDPLKSESLHQAEEGTAELRLTLDGGSQWMWTTRSARPSLLLRSWRVASASAERRKRSTPTQHHPLISRANDPLGITSMIGYDYPVPRDSLASCRMTLAAFARALACASSANQRAEQRSACHVRTHQHALAF